MGEFGVAHADEHDSPAGVTHIICNSDLARRVLPECFMIGKLGIGVGALDLAK